MSPSPRIVSTRIVSFLLMLGVTNHVSAAQPFRIPALQSLWALVASKQQINFFDKNFLKNPTSVNAALKKEGFKDIAFTTQDHYRLRGLFLERTNATATLVCIGGFWPGKKELFAPFLHMVPPTYNLLFFDARGRGQSEGHVLHSLGAYGKREYKDIVAAIECAHQHANVPVVLYGCCSGAFNAVHALLNLQQNNRLQELNIKGLIFDSGWGSVIHAANYVPYAALTLKLGMCAVISPLLTPFISAIKNLFFMHVIQKYDAQTNIFDKIGDVRLPIFFIHSVDDNYAPFCYTERLAQAAYDKTCWWIPAGKSFHVRHHLNHPLEYALRLRNFCNTAITK